MGGFEAVYEKIKAYSEMTKSECAFIYDLCQERKPKKIVEIGVSSGAGSLLLLEATKAELYFIPWISAGNIIVTVTKTFRLKSGGRLAFCVKTRIVSIKGGL